MCSFPLKVQETAVRILHLEREIAHDRRTKSVLLRAGKVVGGKRVFYCGREQSSMTLDGKGVFWAQMAIEREAMKLQPNQSHRSAHHVNELALDQNAN